MKQLSILLGSILFVVACTSSDKEELNLFTLMPSNETGFDFVNRVENNPSMNIFKFRNFYNGGGVAIGDINNDGLSDVFMVANMGANKLYLNKGDFKFKEIGEKAGITGEKPWSTGVTMVDINNDGLLDIYVCNAGNLDGDNDDNDLFINNGDLTFSEKAADYNLAKTGFSTHASFFDYDNDGDLDAYVLNNSNIPVSSLNYAENRELRAKDWNVPDVFKGVGDILFRNDDGKFVDVSEEAGIYGSLIGFGLGVFAADLNGDRFMDIYVSNDFYERDYLYINNQDGTFTEDIKNWTEHLCLSAMGVDMADINNDGLSDIFVTDMLPEKDQRIKSVMEFENYNVFALKQSKDFHQQYIQNTLQINNGNGTFSETAYFSGVAKTDWSWAGLLFDMDNDGFKDLYVTNGINHDLTDIDFVDFFADEVVQKMVLTGEKEDLLSIIDKMPVVQLPNYTYKNGGDLTFENVAKEWGTSLPSFSNGCAYADLDNDGDLDLVVNNSNMESFLFRNNSDSVTNNRYLKINLVGSDKNQFGIGSIVKIHIGEQTILQEIMPSRGFQSSVEYQLTVGVGQNDQIDSLRIVWPDNRTERLVNVRTSQSITLKNSDALSYEPKAPPQQKTLLAEVINEDLVGHTENHFNDFDFEGLITKKLSQEGPTVSIGDVNGDGHEDVFIGAAKGIPAVLYLHHGDGVLTPQSIESFVDDRLYEDTASAFLDVDGDGDLDLMVGSGGNEIAEKLFYHNRLYLNMGNGKFVRSSQRIPSKNLNTSVIAPCDFDKDGDVDVFIGSRSVPGIYGADPEHLFLINDGSGLYTDGTERIAYDTKEAGMITDANWGDMDADGKIDLVTISEWGSPLIFKNSGRRLSRLPTALDSLTGWWETLELSDLDEDGDLDLVIGNKGTNTLYKTTRSNPMKIWIDDYDDNGTIEQIITNNYDQGDRPIHMRKELTMQLVSLKKENLKATDYSKRTMQELFSETALSSTLVKEVITGNSVVMSNDGNGKFTSIPLPANVQFSMVCGISCTDVNSDGNLDILLAGNNYEYKPQFSRLDASYGSLLLGNGKMGFEWTGYEKSGFFLRGEVKHLESFKDKNGQDFLVAGINEGKPKVFSR